MRPAVHVDRPLLVERADAVLDGDQLPRPWRALVEDGDVGGAAVDVRRDVDAALLFRHGDTRRIPAFRVAARAIGERQAGVVAELGAGHALAEVLLIPGRPGAGEIDLRGRRPRAEREQDGGQEAHEGSRRATHGTPSGSTVEPSASLLEVRAGHERLHQIEGIVDHGPHGEPFAAVGYCVAHEVLGDDRLGAVGHAVGAQPAGAEVGRDHFERRPRQAARRRARSAIETVEAAGAQHVDHVGRPVPARRRHALPRRRAGRGRRAQIQPPRLRAGLGVDAQRAVVLPGDVKPPGRAHPRADAERLAAAGLLRLPEVCDAAAFAVERHAAVVALERHHHAVAPVFGDHRHPVAGEVDGGQVARRRRGLRRLTGRRLAVQGHDRKKDKGDSD